MFLSGFLRKGFGLTFLLGFVEIRNWLNVLVAFLKKAFGLTFLSFFLKKIWLEVLVGLFKKRMISIDIKTPSYNNILHSKIVVD